VVPFTSPSTALDAGLSIRVSVGGGPSHFVELDTGSQALIVPESVLGPNVTTPSPQQTFSLEYTSDGLTLSGNVVTAQVTVGVTPSFDGDAGALPTTIPMPVRVVQSASCNAAYPQCTVPTNLDTIGMMGIGFGSDATTTPVDNVLLQIAQATTGAMRPGFVISMNPPQLTVGLPTSTSDFARVALSPGASGDWLASSLTGCARIPSLAWTLCGTLLVDTGIGASILAIPYGEAMPYDGGAPPSGVEIDFTSGADGGSATLADDVTVASTAATTPSAVEMRHPLDGTPLVNTGRHLLAAYDYLFDAKAGEVGFRKAGSP
jgi:hypothetical protein